MEKYIWLFPLLFIFHDMEEIIGFGIWLKKNKSMLDKKYPFISKIYENYSTDKWHLLCLKNLFYALFSVYL
ncbi:HXXEE domain-containing protein [Clostridioides difficile]|nr:HXXEE domain-containing protein [Clostridioides difficile]